MILIYLINNLKSLRFINFFTTDILALLPNLVYLTFFPFSKLNSPWKIQYSLEKFIQTILDFFLVFIETGVEDSSFAYGLLMELTRAYLAYADNSRAQDSAAYAIQVRVHIVITDFMLLASSKKFVILCFGNFYFFN